MQNKNPATNAIGVAKPKSRIHIIENKKNIDTNYTIGSGNNAMSAGPTSIDSGVTVTVPSGSSWTIV